MSRLTFLLFDCVVPSNATSKDFSREYACKKLAQRSQCELRDPKRQVFIDKGLGVKGYARPQSSVYIPTKLAEK